MREATEVDVPALVEMAGRFHAGVEHRFPFDADHMAAQFRAFMANDAAVILVEGGGFIVGVAAPAISNPHWIAAHEVLWWSEDGGGLRLLRAFEDWARDFGADEVKMSHPVGEDRLLGILGRLGHEIAEVAYTKGL